MRKTLIAAATGMLMMACGGMRPITTTAATAARATAAPQDEAISALERACLADPMNAANWARLATAMEAQGDRERAARFYQQAATLSAHDARRDYALLHANPVVARPPDPGVDASLPRTQVRQVGAAMVQVERVPAAALAARPQASPPATNLEPLRLEISNGNGVAGAAARLARALAVDGVKTVRLTNVPNFNVLQTRIEYPLEQREMAETLSQRLGVPLKVRREKSEHADLRIVLGHDAAAGRQFR